MGLTPVYGETPLPHDELDALLSEVVEILDKTITRADVYDLEQGCKTRWSTSSCNGSLPLGDLLSDRFVRSAHAVVQADLGAGRPTAATRRQHRRRARADRGGAAQLARRLPGAGSTPPTGRRGNWGSSCMPRRFAFIRSWTETVAQGLSLTLCSPPPRTPPSSNTTGTSTSRVTPRSCALR